MWLRTACVANFCGRLRCCSHLGQKCWPRSSEGLRAGRRAIVCRAGHEAYVDGSRIGVQLESDAIIPTEAF